MFPFISMKRYVVFATALLALAAPALVRADGFDNLIAVDDVPAVVLDKAKAAAPGVEWDLAFKFPDPKVVAVYRLGGKDSQERRVTATISEAGVVAAVSTEVSMDDVPAVVLAALKAKAPDFEATQVQAVGKTTAKVLFYLFEGGTDDKPVEISVGADGKKVVREGGK